MFTSALSPRQQVDGGSGSGSGSEGGGGGGGGGVGAGGRRVLITLLVFTALLCAFLLVWVSVRKISTPSSTRNSKFVPGPYLKRKWQEWGLRGRYSKVAGRRRGRGDSQPTEYAPSPQAAEEARAADAAAAGVNRNTSIRSVMTLPAYSSMPKSTEQIIGREGERGGMDIVEEFPETAEEQETARDEEMESLYQIREARRREIREREERRAARAEARMRGDQEALDRLRQEARAARASMDNGPQPPTAAEMLTEHQSRGRDRRTSAVSYAALGLVRHDGTRIRSTSQDSERGGLLDGAAPMGENFRPRSHSHSRAGSQGSALPAPQPSHLRNWSASSARSISTTISDVDRDVILTPYSTNGLAERPSSNEHNGNGISQTASNQRSSSSPENNRQYTPPDSDGDIADNSMTAMANQNATQGEQINSAGTEPPDYENLDWGDAPPYSSPVRGPGEGPVHLQSLERQIAQRQYQQERLSQPNITSSQLPSTLTSGEAPPSSQSQQSISRLSNVNRVPTNPPRLPQLRTLPSIRFQSATEPNTPSSPVQRQQQQRQ